MVHSSFVSVIIPYFNDLEALQSCFAALLAQTYSPQHFEILFVRNGDRSFMPAGPLPSSPMVRFLDERNPGSYAARNCAIAVALGETLAFTDADCLPAADWLQQGVRALESGAQVIGGHVELFFMDARHPRIAEVYDRLFFLTQEKFVRQLGFASTANMLCHKSLMSGFGMFRPDLKSGGDREWGQRVSRTGARFDYVKTAIVRHPARATIKSILIKTRRVTGGNFDIARLHRGRRALQLRKDVATEGRRFLEQCTIATRTPLLAGKPFRRLELIGLIGLVLANRLLERFRLELGGSSHRY